MPILFSALGLALAVTARAETTTSYPEVVAVFSTVSFDGKSENPGRCSGTFITPRLLLTASHCVCHFNKFELGGRVAISSDLRGRPVSDEVARPDQVEIVQSRWWGTAAVHPTHVYVSPDAIPVDHGDVSLSEVDQDLAILEFAYPIAAVTRPVAETQAQPGQPVAIVGYGRHAVAEPTGPGFGQIMPIQSSGRNAIQMADLDDYVIRGSAATCDAPDGHANEWTICPGDSGGPLIDLGTGQVIGVASTTTTFSPTSPAGQAGQKLSVFTDVTSARARAFIESVESEAGTHPVGLPQARSGS